VTKIGVDKRTRLELVAIRKILVVTIVSRNLFGLFGASGWGRHLHLLRDAKDLANIHVPALLIELWVIHVQYGRVDTRFVRNDVTGIVFLDDVGFRTVLAFVTKANRVAGLKIRTGGVDLIGVYNCKLIGRNVFGG
jgi:hypothetical protein